MPDSHLNLFRFHAAGKEAYIENNLTRGLAIVLREDPLFRDLFLTHLVLNHHELLDLMYGTPEISVDVQVPVARIELPFAMLRELDNQQLPSDEVKALIRDSVNALGVRFGMRNLI